MTLPRVKRNDTLEKPPADTGCHHSPSCLTCPLPICIHDGGGEYNTSHGIPKVQVRAMTIKGMNLTPEQVAVKFKTSIRQAHRYLACAQRMSVKEEATIRKWLDDGKITEDLLVTPVIRRWAKPRRPNPPLFRS